MEIPVQLTEEIEMMTCIKTFVFLFAAFSLLCPISGIAQIQSGTISGTVVDSSGSVVSNATVTITSDQTGAKRSAATTDTGGFTLTALPPG